MIECYQNNHNSLTVVNCLAETVLNVTITNLIDEFSRQNDVIHEYTVEAESNHAALLTLYYTSFGLS